MRKFLAVILSVILAVAIVVGGYIAYLQFNYFRIEDNSLLEIQNQQSNVLKLNEEYSVMTYNIGFGAYDQEYSFFMDKGRMADGTEVKGSSARGRSYDAVMSNTLGSLSLMRTANADFYLLQEVDTLATRSYDINQKAILDSAFYGYAGIYGNNFHSAYLFYPIFEPHGYVNAGLLSYCRFNVKNATRRSYPVDESFINKFFDLDRCFVMMRIPTENGGDLVLINSHLSAYDKGGVIRKKQFEMLWNVIQEEYAAGNYVIVGGDFNHALCGSVGIFESQQMIPEWVATLDDEDLPSNYSVVKAENISLVPTCRSCDITYQKGVNYTSVLDGFIVSDNVEAFAENIDADFMYSDHNPVILHFRLKK